MFRFGNENGDSNAILLVVRPSKAHLPSKGLLTPTTPLYFLTKSYRILPSVYFALFWKRKWEREGVGYFLRCFDADFILSAVEWPEQRALLYSQLYLRTHTHTLAIVLALALAVALEPALAHLHAPSHSHTHTRTSSHTRTRTHTHTSTSILTRVLILALALAYSPSQLPQSGELALTANSSYSKSKCIKSHILILVRFFYGCFLKGKF